MGKVFEAITPDIERWVLEQSMYFVATAPLSGQGSINCSPKGMDSFRIIGPHEVAYLDMTGSGIETLAHLKENGRIVLMFCAFKGPPKIMRFHGTGRYCLPDTAAFNEVQSHFPKVRGTRGILRIQVARISDSCGFGVPLMDFVEERDGLTRWTAAKSDDELVAYRRLKNEKSIDGLPGLPQT